MVATAACRRKEPSRADIMIEDTAYYTGMEGDMYVGKNPGADRLLAAAPPGTVRFNTYCSPCHDQDRDRGSGIVPTHVPTWQPVESDGRPRGAVRRRRYFQRDHQRPADHAGVSNFRLRWKTAGRLSLIVRVLQRAAHGTVNDVPADQRAELQ